MHAVRIVIEARDSSIEYVTHVVNRSRHALTGAVRNGWRRYPAAKAVTAEFTTHACESCARSHNLPATRRVFKRTRKVA